MSAFFKSFGKGILYLLTLPLVLVVLVFYAAIGIIVFLFLMIKSVVLFFKGKTIFNDFPEDVKVKEILNPEKPEDEVEVIEPEDDPTSSAFTHTYFQGSSTTYPMYDSTPTEAVEVSEPELIEEVSEEPVTETPVIEEVIQPVEESVDEDAHLYDEEPAITDHISIGKDDTDLEHFDLGARRIKKDDELD